ncbi:nuclear pore complex protein DDB_G0274915 [Scaptodrosophila lebanonensis]|uniref:Nuclear pore complex protein DDB_G0274915 n=1 Tax=Drosophila lebanonensis TaxID=7225 RepID=A0A6J2T3C8_DROLE|nr:nuclear pore complex protein DDB_G0274915 [Scaptodrosophila lebanonensis]
MLERIDEQTAAMSQRSERLKMMKLQYQMYFAKLVQNQTLRCIQQTATAPTGPGAMTPIPVLVPPLQTLASAGLPAQQWTFAMATPTPAGMVLTTPRGAADFMQFAAPTATVQQPLYMPLSEFARPNANLYDLRATLRAFDNENADLPPRITPELTGEYQASPTTTTATSGTAATTTASTARDKSLPELSSTSSTRATSSLTFDKLPKAELPDDAEAVAADDVGQPQVLRSSNNNNNNSSSNGPNSRVTKAEHEKLSSIAAVNNEPESSMSISMSAPRQEWGQSHIEENPLAGGRTGEVTDISPHFDANLLDEIKASRDALEKASAAVDEQLARSNQLSPPTATTTATTIAMRAENFAAEPPITTTMMSKPGMSLENIENAIYGERLTTTATTGLFENLVTKQEVKPIEEFPPEQPPPTHADVSHIDFGQYDNNNSNISEPSYASIDSGHQQKQQQQQQEPIYSEIGNPTDYQQYATDATEAAAAQATTAGMATDGMQQDYSNIDYSNYDATEYAAAGYDPNAYPGYIYDEASGQYIADPNAPQYEADGRYAGQEYDAAAATANYDYNAYAEQVSTEQPAEGYSAGAATTTAYAEEGSNNAELEAESMAATTLASDAPPAEVGAVVAKPVKPTSILATTDKQAAPNDAQQQQQKKKKRVNFVDSSETDESSSAKPAQGVLGNQTAKTPATTATTTSTPAAPSAPTVGGSESDFDFSTGSEAKN